MLNKLTGAIRNLLNPATGEAVTVNKNELQEEQTRARSTGMRRANSGISVASSLNPRRLAGVLRQAAEGNALDYFILAEEMEERDLHYSSVLRTRKLTVAGLEPTVEAASDDARDIEIADAVRTMIERPQIPELLFDLLDGLGKGIAVVEILWDISSSTQWVPRDYSWVDPRFLKMDAETLRQVHVLTEAQPFHGEPLAAYKYIVHQPRLKSGLPLRNGLARLVAVMYMLKSFTVRDWWAFGEKFGLPITLGKYGPNASTEDIQTLIDAIASLASDAGCAIPASMQIDMVETASRQGGGDLFKGMAEWCDAQTSKAVLGQTMTTDDGSSQSQANVHNQVRMDIARWDARQLENTLNEFLVRPFIMLNYGPQDNYPNVCLRINEPENLKALVDALIPLIDRGMKVQASVLRDKFGLPEPEAGSDILQPTSSLNSSAGMFTALNHENIALNRQSAPDDIDSLTQEGISDWQRVGSAFTNPVLALASDATSYEDFLARLPELQASLDANEFVDQLARLCFQARGMGDVSDAE
ncbi:DUF935 domain-containing protein [Yersinia enterocolitica]|uniref:DUF935 domain-containing protein n=1 Tax=Yersinia enterocolitica TaxID=630 RepID=UPI0005E976DC|nr:DUF935 domain-containing protein [Yersinia enterocolitica]EKN3387503.1 DUF935 domain-containing protein [Yersinia enterocolitica]EKN3392345.1 DUF935 domain-containing protein [Yersinia enterocolitica]EKN3571205.1 DUF935 domain-containing protein [Yersinia enterocolitica]EKN3586403.1 DUF935 domain-containing protein [Yersinia enterocolitica]EKN3769270.1 DUF935 domain-containing protein [Yersinia enterocolitica]